MPVEVQSKPVSISNSCMDERYKKYQDLPMYVRLVEYLQKGLLALEGINCNQKCQLIWKAQYYFLSPATNISMLRYREQNRALGIYPVDEEIPRFFNTAYEDHGYYAAQLCLNFLVDRVYWPIRVKNVYSWYGSCYSCQLKAYKPIRMKM